MKKVLWCGGSHLGHAKETIERFYDKLDNTFVVTAGNYHQWQINGGRYKVEGSTVSGFHLQKSLKLDFSSFSCVIFIGQYIQPTRYFHGSMPLSRGMLGDMLDPNYFLLHMPSGFAISGNDKGVHFKPYFYNEPLYLFPMLAPNRCFLIPDPMPMNPGYRNVPIFAKQEFQSSLVSFCERNRIRLCSQPESTLSDSLSTKLQYQRRATDYIHVSDDYWRKALTDAKTIIEI